MGHDWVPGGHGRAQARINDVVRQCDYLVLVLHNRWGSPSGQASSGTYEEFQVAKAALEDPDLPMTDILILFKTLSDESISDPGEQLRQVLGFRAEIEQSREFMYKEFSSVDEFRDRLDTALFEWTQRRGAANESPSADQPALVQPRKTTTEINLDDLASLTGTELLEVAGDAAKAGRSTLASAAYARFLREQPSDTRAFWNYTRFLRRSGLNEKAHRVADEFRARAIAKGDETNAAVAETILGVIARKSRNNSEAEELLHGAVSTLTRVGAEPDYLGYALGNLGRTELHRGKLDEAESSFRRAHKLAQERGVPREVAHAAGNLAALYRRQHRPDAARRVLEDAEAIARRADDTSALAAILSDLGRLAENREDWPEAERCARESLDLNEARHANDAIAANLLALSRILRAQAKGNPDAMEAAKDPAERALAINRSCDNLDGIASALHNIGLVEVELENWPAAVLRLDEAHQTFVRSGHANGTIGTALDLADALLKRGGQGAVASASYQATRALAHAEAVGNFHLADEAREFLQKLDNGGAD